MSVGDSVEEFISIHALGRERLLVLSCGSSVTSSQNSVFHPLGDDREFLSQFSTHQPPNVFQQKPDRCPPQITGRGVSVVHQGGVGAPNELATFKFTTLSLISSNEVCGEHEIAPRLTQDLLDKFSGQCWPRSPR